MMNIPFDKVKSDMVRLAWNLRVHRPTASQRSGRALPSFTSILLEAHCNPNKDIIHEDATTKEDEEDIKGAAGTLYAGMICF